mmetsp:Transcript_79794/g.222109  ORF Transcript_79794/g.222109 Transcript_79794/m.222109 type:complete len:205 (+) Transcript_79794:392-1006(+)
MRLRDGAVGNDLCHHFDPSGADHVHHACLGLRAAAPQLLGRAAAVLATLALAIHDGRALRSDAAANDGARALCDVGGALPTSAHLGNRVAQGDLHRFGKALPHGVPELPVGVGAPAEDATAFRDGNCVPPAARKVDDLLVLDEAFDLVRPLLSHTALAVETPAELAKVVVAPRVELSLFGERAHVLVTGADLGELHALQAHLTL